MTLKMQPAGTHHDDSSSFLLAASVAGLACSATRVMPYGFAQPGDWGVPKSP